MKKIVFAVIALFSLLICKAEECRNISAWTEYFAERLDIFDPIEGIFDVQAKIDYNDAPAYSTDYTIVIARISGNLFEMYSLSGENLNIYFQRVGRTNYYYMTNTRLNIRDRIRLEKDGTYLLEHKETERFLYQGYIVKSIHESGIKIFPDESTVKTALYSPMWSGSGFALGDGYVATNNHVAGAAKLIRVYDDSKDTFYPAKLVARDYVNDLAIIKVDDPLFGGSGTVPYAFEEKIKDVASECFVMGYPDPTLLGREVKFTNGTISAWSGYEGDVSTYQISAPATNGNSGGPTFDYDGNIIGILSSGIPHLQNVAYAIKVSYLTELIRSNSLDLPNVGNNLIKDYSMPEKVKALRPYVYFILCSDSNTWEEGVKRLSNTPYKWELPKRKAPVDYSKLKIKNEKRLLEIEILPTHTLGSINLGKWKHIHLSLKIDEYIASLYRVSNEQLSQKYLPLFIQRFNTSIKHDGIVMTGGQSKSPDIEAIWEILKVDDDGEIYSLVSFYNGDDCEAQVYVNGDGGRGDTLVEKSEKGVEQSALELARIFNKNRK